MTRRSATGGGAAATAASDAATCQGKTGETPEPAELGGADDPDGAGKKVGMVFDIGGKDDKSLQRVGLRRPHGRRAENMGVEAKELEPNADGSNREELLRRWPRTATSLDHRRRLRLRRGRWPPSPPTTPTPSSPSSTRVVEAAQRRPRWSSPRSRARSWSAPPRRSSRAAGKIGFVGGVETDADQEVRGRLRGRVAKVDDPDVKVEVKYITPDGDFTGFDDPAKGKTIAAGLYDDGADVIYHAAGGSGAGVFEAAAEADRLAIGVDSDQYLQVDEASRSASSLDAQAGRRGRLRHHRRASSTASSRPARRSFDLEQRRHRLRHRRRPGRRDTAQIDELKQQIIDGEIEVPTDALISR